MFQDALFNERFVFEWRSKITTVLPYLQFIFENSVNTCIFTCENEKFEKKIKNHIYHIERASYVAVKKINIFS